ncbi:flagellar motor protein MotB [Mesobacillus selenatarsenatis]|uniref:Flagellar motor rotation protein MotB n=1 Tax=Mesobacillus selenatarsenatis (strain DSM 18680 / JCM 14380 / FERM P-15431 / SF-1) TaxID=1321606 RepID=A0A0A8XA13_MESS1|nr:flagellar motor protein MotB [Mesobacillus selenatarsenatis]GAM16119.1 flagellar motor rotation protein MotB [Mesobacillus selenatarsenatis SF-1]
MSRKRKKKHHEEHMDESWLIPYADLLTLLLALFIVLFAMSSVDATKFQQLSKAFNDVFAGGTGVFEFQSPMPEGQMESPDERKEDVEKNDEDEDDIAKDQMELLAIQQKVNSYIEEKKLTDKLETKLTDEGLLLTIRDNVLFESGRAEVRTSDINIAKEIADLLVMEPPRNIIISGHTDNVPIRTARYESNWELSVMRAVEFMKIILKNEQLDPRWFSAKGFGEFQPVATNDTAVGKARNRRVEILILPRTSNNPGQ